jgi:PknH-like extracellular domain
MASTLRRAAVVCCAALLSGCSYTYTSRPNVESAPRVDDMIVSVADVRRIAEAQDFAPHTEANLHKPPPADPTAPEPCRSVGYSDFTFGSGWSDFRSAGYKGVTDDIQAGGNSMVNEVTQAVARYPNSDKTQAVFHQLESSLQACVALHNPNYVFTLDKPDPLTLRITDLQWCHLYRVKSAVLISVGVLGLEASDQIANTVLQTIVDRVK